MSQATQRVHIHHPGLLKIVKITPQGEQMIMDELSSLEEGRLESDAIFPIEAPAVLKVTTLSGASYRFIIAGEIMVIEHLNDIEDVNVPSPTNGYVLYWDAAAGKWQAKAIPPPTSKVRAHLDGARQAIPTQTFTKVQLNAEDFDTLDEFDHINNYRFTPKTAGAYLFMGSLRYWQTVANKSFFADLYKNGEWYSSAGFQSSVAGDLEAIILDIVLCDVGDYLELWAWHNSGVNAKLTHLGQTWCAITKLA